MFPITFNFTYTRQVMSQFGIHLIHVINFSNVQNALRISVMYVVSRVSIFVSEGWALERALYCVPCGDCDQKYFGETKRSFNTHKNTLTIQNIFILKKVRLPNLH